MSDKKPVTIDLNPAINCLRQELKRTRLFRTGIAVVFLTAYLFGGGLALADPNNLEWAKLINGVRPYCVGVVLFWIICRISEKLIWMIEIE